MTREEFAELQLRHQKSGRTLKEYLCETGLCYSTYNYWRRKYLASEERHELTPISFMESSCPSSDSFSFSMEIPGGATLLKRGMAQVLVPPLCNIRVAKKSAAF